ncbi:FtsX-like permease family protein [bacterium]|nr:FtsX-like permease family protein [bacterium]
MIRFLIKGLLRDRHRSLFPLLTVTAGVTLTVFFHCWLGGVFGDIIDYNARFTTGHLKVTTKAYAREADLFPNDLALFGVDSLCRRLQDQFPGTQWSPRIRFAGLLDVPDENGETRSQGTAVGLAVDMHSAGAPEIGRLRIDQSLVRGTLPESRWEMLISDTLAVRLGLEPGETVTLVGTTMNGDMAMRNFTVCGTVRFGIAAMDRGAMIIDLEDCREALDMPDAAGEILGFLPGESYDPIEVSRIASTFNDPFAGVQDDFAPFMQRLEDQGGLSEMIAYIDHFSGLLVFVFVLAMSIVLWNAGLIGGLRRYGEIGVRLAIGESKGHVFRAMLAESVCVGAAGSVTGTAVGLALAYWLQVKGLNIGSFMKEASMVMPLVLRARVTPTAGVLGFLPGLFSTVLGSLLAGIGIYRRKTAQLFKELEA